jgi:hypothetical protein
MATVGQCSTVWESGTTLADISHTRGESNALVASALAARLRAFQNTGLLVSFRPFWIAMIRRYTTKRIQALIWK